MTQIWIDPHRIAVPDRPSSGNPPIAGPLEAPGARPFHIVAYPGAGEAATRRAFMAQ